MSYAGDYKIDNLIIKIFAISCNIIKQSYTYCRFPYRHWNFNKQSKFIDCWKTAGHI